MLVSGDVRETLLPSRQPTEGTLFLFLERDKNAKVLSDFLGQYAVVVRASKPGDLDGPWDLAIFDIHWLRRFGFDSISERKKLEEPLFLPSILFVSTVE